jgi:serine protease Do
MKRVAQALTAAVLAGLLPAPPGGAVEARSLLAEMEREVIAIVDRAAPAVVCVTTESVDPPWLDDPEWIGPPGWLESFMENDFFRRKRRTSGTGFLISPEGKILTAQNVIGRAKAATVTLASGREIPARVRGFDPVFGVALLQVKETGLSYLKLGSSGEIRPGSWAIAIGQPYGLASSASWGIISGLTRSGLGIALYEELIQFTAPVNPGDSGGPVLNSRGEVIGVIAGSFSGYRELDFDWDFIRRFHRAFPGMESGPAGTFFRPSQAQGIGLAIPIDLVREALRGLEAEGGCRRGWTGILLESFPGREGVAVSALSPGGPAERAGLKAGDVIRSIDGRPVKSVRQLQKTILLARVGDRISLEVEREGEKITIPVTIGERGTEKAEE